MAKERMNACPGISIEVLSKLKPLWSDEIDDAVESRRIGSCVRNLRMQHSISRMTLASTLDIQVEHLVLVENGLVSTSEAQKMLKTVEGILMSDKQQP